MGEVSVVLVRSAITFFNLLILCRLLGKTQVSQLTFFEYVSGITLGSLAAELSTNLSLRPWPVFVGLFAWGGFTLLTQLVALKSRWMAKMLDGEPVILVYRGQILEENLRRLRMRESELAELLRSQSVFHFDEVELAVLEPRGTLSVLRTADTQPVTPADLGIPASSRGLGIELVVDGEVMDQNLRRLGVNRTWLMAKLKEQGIRSPAEAFLAVVDADGKLYVDRYTDRVPKSHDLSDYPGPN
ncbi:YetF domain-containing protein [Symbiobacterium thermophilum]|uniref:Conserved membrane-associated protein n=2 Tax=Symbiobacterium thermophilum TaxID=2734 RepID=Q67J99_SYMTH|nr:DUF421 domain-containing protein [Symbiobacterium thermophilum]MBY6275562.1 DUF421 domain-containing protein [Symbiobacterium thermophilum]BAD42251.1 conserved membrane-associated protein [Symbiobacterium thermophilum IAM 14863]